MEHPRQLVRRRIVGGSIRPGIARPQRLRGNAGAFLRNLQPENRILLELRVRELPFQNRVDDRARVDEVEPLPHAVASAGPPGVHEPHRGVVLRDLLLQQLRVLRGMPHEERRAEARRECRLRFRDTDLRARHFRRVATDEVIHRLTRRQLRHGRQHAKGVRREEDDVARMAAHCRQLHVRNVFQRVGAARVLRDASILVVNLVRVLVEHDILKDASETDRLKNFRLLLR